MLRRVPLFLKAMLVALVVSTIAGALQCFALWHVLGASVADTAAAIAAPLAMCVLACGLYTAYLVSSKTAPLRGAFERLARGDFSGRLPPAPDPEFEVVEQAFTAMGTALESITQRLRHADAQRRRLFADLAHELATPTSSILGVSEALASPAIWSAAPERDRMLGALEHEAVRLERLIRDVRELAYLDDPDTQLVLEPADLADIARRAAERTSLLVGRSIEFRAEPCPARVDPIRVDQIMVNLLTNAIRHTPADGTILVCVAKVERGRASIVVEDSGPGVPDELLPRLGERLLRLDPSRNRATGGNGLGLSIVSAVAQRHGGVARFEHAALGGLRVVIDMPAE